METKKYEVLAEITIGEVTHQVGETIELNDEQAVEYGESIRLVEEGADQGSEGTAEAE